MNRTVAWTVLGGIAALAAVAQFVPVDRSNPPISREIRWDSEQTADLARRACYDCHSNETDWPLYARLAPASWLVAKDVREGRDHLNFSEWDQPTSDAPDEIVGVVEDGEMPLRKYTLLHPSARLSAVERALLVQGLFATLAVDPPLVAEGQEGDDGHEH